MLIPRPLRSTLAPYCTPYRFCKSLVPFVSPPLPLTTANGCITYPFHAAACTGNTTKVIARTKLEIVWEIRSAECKSLHRLTGADVILGAVLLVTVLMSPNNLFTKKLTEWYLSTEIICVAQLHGLRC